uniref:PPPDE peptidase domain-containing protein 2 n=1 Tax=Lygus hesperus TaxID=30085 RepID=A0A0A9XEV8_LYGHE
MRESNAPAQTAGRACFGAHDYNLLRNNCNHFTHAASRFLLNTDIPEDIINMIPTLLNTPLGRMMQPMLEQMTTGPHTQVTQRVQESCVGLTSTKTTLSEDEEGDLITIQAMM